MFKLITHHDHRFKSHDIVDLWKFVVSHPDWGFVFYVGYEVINHDEFLKTYLVMSGS